MSDSTDILHNWLYVMIPSGPQMEPTFCAFCKNCKMLYTEVMPYKLKWTPRSERQILDSKTPSMKISDIPRMGCNPDGLNVY